ncbi:MAG: DUF4998 domain-containing protein [Chitinophagaceae bacterium]
MKIKKYILLAVPAIAAILYVSSCSKMDDYKKEFLSGGEIVYAGALDTVIAQSGYKRINLKMVLGSDPQVTKIKVYWNDKQDSVEIAVQRPVTSNTINYMISDLAGGNYNFIAYTYDSQNHSSVVRNASGVAYDDTYLNSLANRTIKSSAPSTNVDSMIIKWNDANSGQIDTEIKYLLADGTEKVKKLLPADTLLGIPDGYKGGSLLQYRSRYLPNATAYDTFTVPEYSTLTLDALPLYERQMDKSLFKMYTLPTDVGASTYTTWVMSALWNNTYNAPGYATAVSTPPVWFTFDMGESAKINRFIYWMPQDRIFNLEAVKSFEIWGSNAPASDGSWASWTYLSTFTSVKPSGSALGTNTAADIAAAAAGQELVMPDNIPKTRYIRIKVLSNWGTKTFQAMGELTFYTRDRK